MSETFEKVLTLLRKQRLMEENISTEEFQKLMCEFSDERLDILQWLLSMLSEDYAPYFQKSPNLCIDLAQKLHQLQFVKSSDQLLFVEGKLSVEDQKLVLNKVLKAINCIEFMKNQDLSKKEITCLKNQEKPNQVREFKGKNSKWTEQGRKRNPHFDFRKANYNLEQAAILIEHQPTFYPEIREQNKEVVQSGQGPVPLSDFSITELKSLTSDFKQHFSTLKPLSSEDYKPENSEPVLSELSTCVEKLHGALNVVDVQENIVLDGLETIRKVDLRKTKEDILSFKRSSKVLQLNKLYSTITLQPSI